MNTTVLPRPSARKSVVQKPPTGNDLLEAVALALEARGSQQTKGYEGIERRKAEDVLAASADTTVFGWIAEEMAELGVKASMNTVGETLSALGVHGGEGGIRGFAGAIMTDQHALHHAAHTIGCHCHGAVITAQDAAGRVRSLKIKSD
ncbi:MAG: hypothetical protein WDZ93_04235 [Candidatus Paceibacterota bacterium]